MKKLILDEKEMVAQYEKLKNVNKVAEFFNISVSTVQRRLRNNNIIFTYKNETLNQNDVLEQYSSLKSIHKVAKHFNMSVGPIKKILKSNGIDLTNRRYEVNHNYFDIIDTEEKVYWLGFLYADGYIRERKSGNSLEMKLSIKDKHHLELFRKSVGSNHIIVDGYNKVKYKEGISSSHMSSLAIYSSQLVESIKSQGFHSRKTFTIENPKINDDLIHHFIRGYFDGDGSFSFVEKKRNTSSFACASKNFREFIINELSKNKIKTSYYGGISLYIQNKVENKKFYNYIYNNATIYLERKKEIYERFREYYKYNN
jgi:intein-encoded DNA endonuclease-like protein